MENEYTFGNQSEAWLADLKTRRRKPISSASIATFAYHVKRLVPLVGADTTLASINSGTLRDLVGKLIAEELGPKTIKEAIAVVKQVIASAVDSNGDPLFPKTFNAKYIDCPGITKQKQPCPDRSTVEKIIKQARDDQQQLLFAILAGAGLRISEALAIRIQGNEQQTSWSEETGSITVRSTIWRGQEQLDHTKSVAGAREVDLYAGLNDVIAKFVAKHNRQPGGFLLQSVQGQPMRPKAATNFLRKHGVQFHGLRRFRITHLREYGVPEDIIRFWVGHSTSADITDRYSKLAENAALRKSWAQRAGILFDLDDVGEPGRQRRLVTNHQPPSNLTRESFAADPRSVCAAVASEERRRIALDISTDCPSDRHPDISEPVSK